MFKIPSFPKLCVWTVLLCCGLFLVRCTPPPPNHVYKSETLIIKQLTPGVYQHISYLETNTFGKVACNGMVYHAGHETFVFDTPTNNEVSDELIAWINDSLNAEVKGLATGHFHEDCLGGIQAFHDKNIPSYAYFQTIEFAYRSNKEAPQNGFNDSLVLFLNEDKKIILHHPGEGHTADNIIGYIPSEKAMFGGCLIKCLGADKGYLGDANTTAWSTTVEQVKQHYPQVQLIVPGHGPAGQSELLDYTIQLFQPTSSQP